MSLAEMYKSADYKDKNGMLFNDDCMNVLSTLENGSDRVNLTLTDIPYGAVNRENGMRVFDKGNADIVTFDLLNFLDKVYSITDGTIIIFCGKEQFSTIFNYFAKKQNDKRGTVRQIIWQKSNPAPLQGQYIYLSGIENAVWFKKRGATFNAHCKNTVFKYPNGRSKIHPTEKNHDLIKELILDNSNEGDIVFDPCCGSAAHCLCAEQLNRKYIGVELDKQYFDVAVERMKNKE